MHLPIDKDALARVVSARLANGNENEYRFQEDCGASDTTTFVRLVKKSDIHDTVIVGVGTSIAADDFEKQLLERRFDQNLAFLRTNDGIHSLYLLNVFKVTHRLSNSPPLSSSLSQSLAVGQLHEDFAHSWTAYGQVEGWPLASNWHQLKPEIRKTVVENMATFVRELALAPAEPPSNPSVDYVGSVKMHRILFPKVLAVNPTYWLNDRELEGVTSYAELVTILAENRASMLDLHAKDVGTKSLVAKQICAVLPVAAAVLSKQSENVLAHANLLPQNIWIDPFNGKVTAVFGWEYAHYAPVWMATAPLGWLMEEKRDWMLESEKAGDPWGVWRRRFDHPPENTAKEMRQLQRVWDDTLTVGDGIHQLSPGGVRGEEDDKLRRMALKVCFVEEKEMPKAVSWAWEMAYSVAPYRSTERVNLLVLIGAACLTIYNTYQRTEGVSPLRPDSIMRNPMVHTIIAMAIIVLLFSLIQLRRHFPPYTGEAIGEGSPFEKRKALKMRNGLFEVILCAKIPWAFGYGAFTKDKVGVKELAALPCSPANSIAPIGIYIPGFMSRAVTMMSRAPTVMEEK